MSQAVFASPSSAGGIGRRGGKCDAASLPAGGLCAFSRNLPYLHGALKEDGARGPSRETRFDPLPFPPTREYTY